jgi:TolB-like protein
MAIWSAEIRELEKLYESIKIQLPDLEKELERLIKADDENMILLYSRRCLEVIITDLCEYELKRPRKTEPLKGIIDKLHKEGKVPSHIIASMQSLNSLSTFGAHPKDFDPEQIKPVLINLDIIIKWYLKHKDLQIECRQKQGEEKCESKQPIVSALEKSIAVLPFQDMSPQKDQEYFCDGMAEEIINALTHIERLKVIARTSAFAFKDKNEDIREIGKKLGVETLLEGSIRKADDRLRITAQLIKVDDGSHIWSERYDRDMKDVFAIQDEISLAIVDNLKVMLLGKEKTAILKRHTGDLDAYKFYLQGRQARQRKDLEGFNHALEYLEKSIALDSKFALAYAEIAFTYVLMAWFCWVIRNDELREKIVYYANKALTLDEHASEAYVALALTWELFDNDQVKAEKFANQAVSLNPGNSEAIQEHGYILGRIGDFENAISKMETTIALDPLSVQAHNGLGHIFLYQGNFASAIKQAQAMLVLDPTFFPGRFLLSLSFTEIEEYSKALLELNKCPQLYPSVIAHRGYLYGKMKRNEEAINTLKEIKSRFSKDPLLEYLIAVIYAGMDDNDNAFDWLQRSQDKHGFIYRDRTRGTDYRIASLRKDPKFRKLIYY